jgi:hypothetical protein
MSKRALLGGLLLLLAACNLNMAPNNSTQTITGVPVVQIISPLPNAAYLDGVPVNIQALISNAGPDIDRVEIAVDDVAVASLESPNEAGAASFSIAQSWTAEGAGPHTITVTALRADGSSSTPITVTISVVDQLSSQSQPSATPDSSDTGSTTGDDADDNAAQSRPTSVVEPTDPPEPTEPPEPTATPTPDKPMATFTTGVNVRRGPDVLFEPPIGSFAAADSAEILAVNPERTWYKVRYYNAEGWVFGNLLTTSGNVDSLPTDAGPPKPTLTPTPIPVTPTPQLNVNLVAGNITTRPSEKECGKKFDIYIDVANFGQNKSPGGSIRVRDIAPDGTVTEETQGAFPEIEPGKTVNVGPIPITVDTYFNEEHTLVINVDSGNAIAETNEDDNRGEREYDLEKGSCG